MSPQYVASTWCSNRMSSRQLHETEHTTEVALDGNGMRVVRFHSHLAGRRRQCNLSCGDNDIPFGFHTW